MTCTFVFMTALLTAPGGGMDLSTLEARFANPPKEYRLVQYLGHGSPVVPAEKMLDHGIGGVMLFLGSHDYLRSEAGWDRMVENVAAAKAAGMTVWVGDDNGYPSGTAGGRVVEADAAHEVRGLMEVSALGSGVGETSLGLPEGAERFVCAWVYPVRGEEADLSAAKAVRVEGDRVVAETPEGRWRVAGFALKVIDEGTQANSTARQFGTSGRYANLLHAGAMETFVDLTHREYARRLGPLGGKIDYFYTNEPNLMTLYFKGGARPGGEAYVPWDASLPERFQAEHGYDLLPRLAGLFGGESDEARLVRRHFYETVGRRLAENFSGRIARWAEGAGVKSGGHLLLEEYTAMHVATCGDFLRVLGEQHVPGCDIPMPDPGDEWNYWMPKYVASAAFLNGREMTTALLDPIIGRPQPILHPEAEDFRRYLNMAHLAGMNQVTTYLPWEPYGPETYRQFNAYAGRLALMLRGAENATAIAMYYPIETFQANFVPSARFWSPLAWDARFAQASQDDTAKAILEAGLDFLYLDARAVLEGDIRDGCLYVNNHPFRTVVMPGIELLPLGVLQKLRAFEMEGGTVVWVDRLPALGDAPEEHAAVRGAVEGCAAVKAEAVPGAMGAPWPENFALDLGAPAPGRFVGRYHHALGPMYYVVNNTDAAVEVPLRGPAGAVSVFQALDGTVSTLEVPGAVQLAPWSAAMLLTTR